MVTILVGVVSYIFGVLTQPWAVGLFNRVFRRPPTV